MPIARRTRPARRFPNGDSAVTGRLHAAVRVGPMRRWIVILMTVAATMATLVACGGPSDDEPVAAATAAPDTPVTTATPPSPTAAPAGPTTPAARTQPAIQISRYAEAGDVPPGRVTPVQASAWRATGTGWAPGNVSVSIRRGGNRVLDVTARANTAGGFEQTFVMPTDAPAGSYTAVATQAPISGQASFTVKAPPANVPAEEMVEAVGARQLWAERQANGLLCSVLRVNGTAAGQVCNEGSEQDFNGDATLRYSAVADEPTVVLGVTAPSVAKVRIDLHGGTAVERAPVAASFTTAGRFVMLTLPAGAAIRTISALDADGRALTTFSISP